MNKATIQSLIDVVVRFREDRDWKKLTSMKNIAIALSLEAAEVLEHFKWKTDEEVNAYIINHKTEIEEELMDVLFNALLMIERLGTNVDTMFMEKMEKNNRKYPIEKVKGKNPHI